MATAKVLPPPAAGPEGLGGRAWEGPQLFIEYQEHPEAKSLAPDGTPCEADTNGLLRRAHVIAGELRYVGKETDRKWEEGDDFSVLEFKTTEYGRKERRS